MLTITKRLNNIETTFCPWICDHRWKTRLSGCAIFTFSTSLKAACWVLLDVAVVTIPWLWKVM